MEILYIWIKGLRELIKEQGLNFSGKYRFHYNEFSKQLEIHDNKDYLENFFCITEEFAKISNVTAIIGQNGVGKSSILEFIRDNFVYGGTRKGLQEKSIIVLQNVSSKKLYIYYHSEIPVEIKNSSSALYDQPIPYDRLSEHIVGDEKGGQWLKNMEDTSFIFFSNLFDNKHSELRDGNYLDISTNHLLQTENRGRIYRRPIEAHRVADTIRQVRFLEDFNVDEEKRLNGFPRQMVFSLFDLEDDFYDRFEKIDELKGEAIYDWNDQVTNFTNDAFDDIKFTQQGYGEFLNNLLRTLTYYCFLAVYDIDFNFEDPKLGLEEFMDPNEKLHHLFEKGLSIQGGDLATSLEELFDALFEYLKEHPECVQNERQLLIPVEKGGFLIELLERYLEVNSTSYGDFAVFQWLGISSGQKAFLNICSRFYYTKTSFLNRQVKQNLIILIDEAEVSLHPQWQKDLIRYLLTNLPFIYRGTNVQNIQLILTSNSPFIISDLPSSNVIFLQKEQDQNRARVLDGLDDKKQTFASNIHSLLAQSFFMQDGLMGTFAQEKVNQLIQLFIDSNGTEVIRKNKERIEKTINIIGEPLIKNKLLAMLRERLTMNFITVEERIEALEMEIRRLKQSDQGDGS